MRDNSIAGGISVSETPRTALVREAFEECSLPGAVAARATGAGCVSYISVRNEAAGGEIGLVQPEVQFCFDLELFPRFAPPGGSDAGSDGDGGGYGVDEEVPRVNDDEVAGFECLSVAEVWGCLVRGEFKPNAAFVLVDFLLRRGFIGVGGGDGSVEKEKEKDDDADGRFEIPGEVYAEVVSRLHRRICLDEF